MWVEVERGGSVTVRGVAVPDGQWNGQESSLAVSGSFYESNALLFSSLILSWLL